MGCEDNQCICKCKRERFLNVVAVFVEGIWLIKILL